MTTMTQAAAAFVKLLKGNRKAVGNRITMERITSVYGNGQYGIRGTWIPASGTAQLKVGDRVAVAWRNGQPYLILAHQSRRAKFGAMPTVVANPILEQLLIVGEEVYFRNDQQVVSLDIRAQLPEGPADVRWGGAGDNAFIVMCAPSFKFFVFELSRPDKEGAGGNSVTASLVQTVDLGVANITLLDLHLKSHSNPMAAHQEINSAGPEGGFVLGELHTFVLNENFDGHLVVKVDLEQLVAGKGNVDDGSVNTLFPTFRVIGDFFQYQLFQIIDDFWLAGDGSEDNPYKIMLSLLVDYIVNGNGTNSGTSNFLVTQCSALEGLVFTYGSSDNDWTGELRTRAGYIINATDGEVVHSGTGAALRIFDNDYEGGYGEQPQLNSVPPEVGCTNLQQTSEIPGDGPPSGLTGLTYDSGAGVSATEVAFAPNLLDPTDSPFMLEDPLTEVLTSSGSPGPHFYAISGQAKPNNPFFRRDSDDAGGTSTTAVNTVRMLSCRVLHLDPDPDKTRLLAVLRHDHGVFTGVQPQEFIWAVKVVVLDGNFAVKFLLSDWARQIFRIGPGAFDFEIGEIELLSSNANHVLWREHLGSTPTGNPGPLSGSQYAPVFRTLLANIKTGVVLVVTSGDSPDDSTDEDAFDSLGLGVVGVEVDFFYESKEDERRCLVAWNLEDPTADDYKDPTLDTAALVEDIVLDAATKLLDLPDDLATPTAKYVHGINDHAVLDSLGRSEPDP